MRRGKPGSPGWQLERSQAFLCMPQSSGLPLPLALSPHLHHLGWSTALMHSQPLAVSGLWTGEAELLGPGARLALTAIRERFRTVTL